MKPFYCILVTSPNWRNLYQRIAEFPNIQKSPTAPENLFDSVDALNKVPEAQERGISYSVVMLTEINRS